MSTDSRITKRSVGLFFAKAAVLSAVFAFVKVDGEMFGLYLLILPFFSPMIGILLFAAALAAVAGTARFQQPFAKKLSFAAYTAGLIAVIVGACIIMLNSLQIGNRVNLMRTKFLAKHAEVILDCETAGYSKLLDSPNLTEDTDQLVLIDYDSMRLSFQYSTSYSFYLNSERLKRADPDLTGTALQFESEIPSPAKSFRTYYRISDSGCSTPSVTELALVEMEDGSIWYREVGESTGVPFNGELKDVLENYDEMTPLTDRELPENPYGAEYVSAAVDLDETPAVTVFSLVSAIKYEDGSSAEAVYTETYHLHERDKLENVRPIAFYRLNDKGDTLIFFLVSWLLEDGSENAQYYGYGVMTSDGRLLTEENKFLTGYHTSDIARICKDRGGIYLDQLIEYPMISIAAGDDPDDMYRIIG